MREILFRGKRVGDGEWAYGDLLHCDDEAEIYSESVGKNGGYVIPDTAGQYTGLTDKNGTRIFEGDIVKTSHGGSTYYAKIEWDDGSFWVTNHDIQMPSYISEVSKTYLEVIGNVHDNPELLKGD